MPDLTTFHYLRWARHTATGKTVLQGSDTEHGPWHPLTKRETRTVLAMAQAEAAKQRQQQKRRTTIRASLAATAVLATILTAAIVLR